MARCHLVSVLTFDHLFSEVVNVHIRMDCLEPKSGADKEAYDLRIDLDKVRPVSRLGYCQEYTVILKDFSSPECSSRIY
jgi:hypothetical protein